MSLGNVGEVIRNHTNNGILSRDQLGKILKLLDSYWTDDMVARVLGDCEEEIQIEKLLETWQNASPVETVRITPRTTLRQVIIVHRHGARFPNGNTGPEDPTWPNNEQFWKLYKGMLTPLGCTQLTDLGRQLREYYVENLRLFACADVVDGKLAACYTSNVQRTLQSAWSFLHGFLDASSSVFFSFRTDRIVEEEFHSRIGVPIFIQDTKDKDRLFHEFKVTEDHKSFKKENIRKSPFLNKAAEDPAYQVLLQKLHDATGDEKLQKGSGAERMAACKKVSTAIDIQEVHRQPILPNKKGITLTAEERGMLRTLAGHAKQCWFQDSVAGTMADSFGGGKKAAPLLAHTIWTHLRDRSSGKSHLRFIEFSCHDTTLAALANHLAIELLPGEIGFGGYWIFELHEGDDESSGDASASTVRSPEVRIFFNRNPTEGIRQEHLEPHVPQLDSPKCLRWEDLPAGSLPLEALKSCCHMAEIEECFQAIAELMRRPLDTTRERLQELLENDSIKGHTSKSDLLKTPSGLTLKSKSDSSKSFEALDLDQQGVLSREEIQAMLSEWKEPINTKMLDVLWNLFDKDGDSKLSAHEFEMMMRALDMFKLAVGTRS